MRMISNCASSAFPPYARMHAVRETAGPWLIVQRTSQPYQDFMSEGLSGLDVVRQGVIMDTNEDTVMVPCKRAVS